MDLLTLLMLAIGGRVIPFFTGRKIPDLKIRQSTPLNIAVNAGAAAFLLLGLAGINGIPRGACMLALALTPAAVLRLAIGPAGWIWAACAWVLAFLVWLVVMTPVLLRDVPTRVEAVRT